MPDIKHAIDIAAPVNVVAALVTTPAGLGAWWAEDVTTSARDASVELGFFDRATVYRLTPEGGDSTARWRVETGKEWAGTRLVFSLRPEANKTHLEFAHENWTQETPYFTSCNTVWGHLLFRLKEAAERSVRRPFFTKSGTQ